MKIGLQTMSMFLACLPLSRESFYQVNRNLLCFHSFLHVLAPLLIASLFGLGHVLARDAKLAAKVIWPRIMCRCMLVWKNLLLVVKYFQRQVIAAHSLLSKPIKY